MTGDDYGGFWLAQMSIFSAERVGCSFAADFGTAEAGREAMAMSETLFGRLFPKRKPIIAMIHVFEGGRKRQIDQALEDLDRLQPYMDAVLTENYGWGYADANQATEETGERLYEITAAVVKQATIPVGVNVLPNDCWQAFNIALQARCRFIQMDHVTGEFDGCESVDPDDFLWTRKCYRDIAVFGGIHPKYYDLCEPTCSLAECAKKAALLAEGVVVTGQVTGDAATLADIRVAREALDAHPLIIGSGLTPENAREQLAIADGAIVGTALKDGGVHPGSRINIQRVQALMEEVGKLRGER